MATTITYTTTATDNTVKPTQTKFTNSTDKSITLKFSNGGDLSVAQGATSDKISTTINAINYNATVYYSSHVSYTIPAGKTATVTKSGANLVMTIP